MKIAPLVGLIKMELPSKVGMVAVRDLGIVNKARSLGFTEQLAT
jgi:hypothetical protein